MEKETNKKVLPKKSILAVVIALLLCGGAYAGITAYVGNTDETVISPSADDKEDALVSADDDREPVESVVTDSEEVEYEPYEIGPVSTEHITIEQPGDESIAQVENPNSSDSKVITLLTKGVRFVRIVYKDGDSSARIAAQKLNTLLAEETGYELEVVSDAAGESSYEILVGDTNRSTSKEAKEYMTKQGAAYAVRSTDKKIALVGSNATGLNKAAAYMGEEADTSQGQASYDKNQSHAWNSGNKYQSTIFTNDSLSAKTTKLYDIKAGSEAGVPQGGCSDGTYFYQMLITKQDTKDENNNECKIVKVNFKTGDVVKISDALPLNHANDVTYNSKLKCLVVCHNAPNRSTLSYVDVNSLKITKTFKIAYDIYCIDYNASTDRYVVGLSGGQTFRILDGNFDAVGKIHTPVDATKDHTTQGVGSDDEFIYFALYMSGTKCVISVFDWEGNHVGILHLDDKTAGTVQGREIETVSVVDGEIYLSCASPYISSTSPGWDYSEIYKVTELKAK